VRGADSRMAGGISLPGVKILTRKSKSGDDGGNTKVVSDRFISRAMASSCSSVKPSASTNTASGLPVRARSVNTSTW